MALRVHVDPGRCQGHNRCYSIAPDLFELDELGMSSALGGGLVPPALAAAARRAAANCPEYAVSVSEVREEP
jgi:ferredoxin